MLFGWWEREGANCDLLFVSCACGVGSVSTVSLINL